MTLPRLLHYFIPNMVAYKHKQCIMWPIPNQIQTGVPQNGFLCQNQQHVPWFGNIIEGKSINSCFSFWWCNDTAHLEQWRLPLVELKVTVGWSSYYFNLCFELWVRLGQLGEPLFFMLHTFVHLSWNRLFILQYIVYNSWLDVIREKRTRMGA
jgi:hypothetical protein